MSTVPQIVIAGPDPKLREELEAALSASGGERPILHAVNDFRQGIEAARSRRPELALIEMTSDLRMLKTFSEEGAIGSPETGAAPGFRPHVFCPDVSRA